MCSARGHCYCIMKLTATIYFADDFIMRSALSKRLSNIVLVLSVCRPGVLSGVVLKIEVEGARLILRAVYKGKNFA